MADHAALSALIALDMSGLQNKDRRSIMSWHAARIIRRGLIREVSIMSRIALAVTVIGSLLAVLLHAAPAQATNVRSWVASNGSGSSCTRLAPCANFSTAATQTDPGGVISCVDAGDY